MLEFDTMSNTGLIVGLFMLFSSIYAITTTMKSSAEVGRKYFWVIIIFTTAMCFSLGFFLWLFWGPKE